MIYWVYLVIHREQKIVKVGVGNERRINTYRKSEGWEHELNLKVKTEKIARSIEKAVIEHWREVMNLKSVPLITFSTETADLSGLNEAVRVIKHQLDFIKAQGDDLKSLPLISIDDVREKLGFVRGADPLNIKACIEWCNKNNYRLEGWH